MDAEFDFDLAPDQWEALKALRAPARMTGTVNQSALAQLIALQLAEARDDRPVITPKGRRVLLRGSPRLWDVAA